MSSPGYLVDTHCHLNLAEHFPEPGRVIDAAHVAGVEVLILVGIDVPTSRRALEIAEEYKDVYAVVGHHPNYASAFSPADLKAIEEIAGHPKAVAIGEIGLDYHWNYATPADQAASLRDQLELARNLGKPVVFHCRDAYPDLLNLLEASPLHPYLFHCFSGSSDDASRVMALDGYFGVDGPITYRKSESLRQLVSELPLDRLVVETDSPYLSPEPVRSKPNSPQNLPTINNALGSCLGLSPSETASLTTRNAERFFGFQRAS